MQFSTAPDSTPEAKITEFPHDGQKLALEAEVRTLKAQLLEQEERIAMLQATLADAAEQTREKIKIVREMRQYFENRADEMAAITSRERGDSREVVVEVQELTAILDSIETSVEKLYMSRRWRFANFISWLAVRIGFSKDSDVRGYWPVDDKLGEYREWLERHRSRRSGS